DELDRIIDYEDTVQDFMKDLPLPENPNVGANGGPQRETRDEDQEIQIKRKRNPIPKLDEDRLLSDAGIPKLRKIAKTRLKFRGKGHEFSDMSRLLNTYQIWLDDLYPRAKFRDALTMVEKVGHSKRMQITRRAWLDETKP
ncbi:Swi3-domain-containing protein, partial [Dissoconium aciculare CBS 342.82]|uniref:Chromosome segregation in meiosis protein n=1 Tax=Dissoconium aciculare CBS 342.82 TaxID=1314786 RepID=A0A6J3MIT2_9PEZI